MNQLQRALDDLRIAHKRERRRKERGSTGEHEFSGPWGRQPGAAEKISLGELADKYRQIIDEHLGYGAGVIIDQYVTLRLQAHAKGEDSNSFETMMETIGMLGQLRTGDGEWVRPPHVSTITWVWRFLRHGREADLRFAEQECRSKYEREPYSYNALLVRAKMARYGSAAAASGLAANVVISAAALISGVDWFLSALPYIIVVSTSIAGLGEYCHERYHFHEPRFHLSDPERRVTVLGAVELSEEGDARNETARE